MASEVLTKALRECRLPVRGQPVHAPLWAPSVSVRLLVDEAPLGELVQQEVGRGSLHRHDRSELMFEELVQLIAMHLLTLEESEEEEFAFVQMK